MQGAVITSFFRFRVPCELRQRLVSVLKLHSVPLLVLLKDMLDPLTPGFNENAPDSEYRVKFMQFCKV